MWHQILTFGSEGSEPGNFCRPWGVAIAKYADLNTLCDREANATSNTTDTFGDWSSALVGPSFADSHLFDSKQLYNNNSIALTLASPWAYLIAVADRSNNRVQLFKFEPFARSVRFLSMFGDGPGARHGQFDRPAGIVINPKLEQIIVADKDNHRIQVFNISGQYLFKFGERGSKCGQFCYPWDVDVCKTSHNVIVSDTRNRRIQMFNNLGRYLAHFTQPLDSPRGVAYLSPTQILVSDFNKHRLVLFTQGDDKMVSSSTSISNEISYLDKYFLNPCNQQPPQKQNRQFNLVHETKFVGFGEGSSWGEFLRPQGATTYGSTVYCSDSRNNRIACWDNETQTFSYISRDVAELDRPAGLAAIDSYIVIVDFGNNRVHICQRSNSDNAWQRILTFGSEGSEPGKFCRPWGVAIAKYSDLNTLCDRESSATSNTSDTFGDWSSALVGPSFADSHLLDTKQFGNSSTLSGYNNNSIASTLASPWSAYLIAVADRSNNRVQLFKFDPFTRSVNFISMFGDGPGAKHGQFDRPAGICINTKLEQIIVADKDNHRVQVFNTSGRYLFKFGERGGKCGQFCYPWDVDVCKTTQNIIVSDTRNRRIQMFSNLGSYLAHFTQPLDSPRGVAYLSPTQILVSDFNKHRLVLFTQGDDKMVSSSTSISNEISYLDKYFLNPCNQQPPQKQNRQFNLVHETKFVGFGEGSSWGEFLRPQGATAYGSTVYCSDSRNNRIACWNKDTRNFNYIGKDVVELDRPAGLAAIDDYIVIVDFGNNRVHICQR